MIGDVLWTPPADFRETTEVGRYMNWLRDERGHAFDSYDELQRWSVVELEQFWGSIADFYELRFHAPYEQVLASREMPGAQWFKGATLNYAEHLVGREEDADTTAVIARSQTRDPLELTFGELRELAGRARAGLQRLGVGPGDRVVAYLPNVPETLAAFIATASLGAIWATCAPEFGTRSVVDRFAQIEPKVLLAVGGYGYRNRYVDRRAEVQTIRERLHTLQHTVWVPVRRGEHRRRDALAGADRGSGAARVRSGRLRPPPVRAVLLRHDRIAEGDRPRPRRAADRASQEPGARLGPQGPVDGCSGFRRQPG